LQPSTVNAVPRNIVTAVPNNDGSLFLRFAGITGRQYKIQGSATLMTPNWVDLPVNSLTVDTTKFVINANNKLNTITANAAGFIEYTDLDAQVVSKFYRAVVAP
jgi:hypothetical protein